MLECMIVSSIFGKTLVKNGVHFVLSRHNGSNK